MIGDVELARHARGFEQRQDILIARDVFHVAQMTLLLEDVRGIWHPVRERILRADA